MARLILAALLVMFSAASAAESYDLVIRNGQLLDGTGSAAVPGEIAVQAGRIAAVGRVSGKGRIEIEAAGLLVTPGFIDVHTHADDLDELPMAENFLRMGVTTLITGNCGSSRLDIAGFFASLVRAGIAPNLATLVGHNTVREEAMGGSLARPPTPAEGARMRQLVERAMLDGAVGLSTGLIYLPGTFAAADEIVDLAKVAATHGGIYATHLRYENARILEALEECLLVARAAHIPVQVSHLKLSGPSAWGRAEEVLSLLNRARAEGLAISHDQYVYTAASAGIGSRIPEQARAGGRDRYRERLADPALKAGWVAEMKATLERNRQADYGFAVIASFPPDPRLDGKSIPEAARLLRGTESIEDQIETILELEARGGAQAVFHGIHEADLQQFLADPHTMIGSDSGVRKFGEGMPHPRGYGNNARVLSRYVRELKLLPLPEAVRRMTSLPARTFRLDGRGALRVGAWADIVVFDPQTVSAPATFEDPHRYADGFRDVIVNGVPVIRGGELTGARPGRPLRRGDPGR